MDYILKTVFITLFSLMIPTNAGISDKMENIKEPVRVLLVTGGHDFDREPFYKFMGSLPGIVFTEVSHPDAMVMFRPENRASFDVALFYDMPRTIGEQEKNDFVDCLNEGKGIVVWHHAYCSYQNWAEYQNIIGGRYHERPWTDSTGVRRPASTFKYDVKMRVKVADPNHPITAGISDFDIIDEAYANGVVNPDVHVLLTTDEPLSTPSIAWTNRYGNSKIVTILLGHDNKAWSNPDFAKFFVQAIVWASEK